MSLLRATDVFKTYRLGRVPVPVLRGASIVIEPGEFVAILGASGSGKSTLLHILGGLDRADTDTSAHIEFDDRDVTAMSARALDRYRAADVGFVFQSYHLLPELTVLDNVAVGAMILHGALGYLAKRATLRERAKALLESVGLGHRLRHRPSELSGGERQRVAIARALINEPRLLLADEPTGNLDRTSGDAVLELFETLRRDRGLTLVLVTHDEAVASRAERVVRLEDGRVVSSLASPSRVSPTRSPIGAGGPRDSHDEPASG